MADNVNAQWLLVKVHMPGAALKKVQRLAHQVVSEDLSFEDIVDHEIIGYASF
jgi:hypothetical protein